MVLISTFRKKSIRNHILLGKASGKRIEMLQDFEQSNQKNFHQIFKKSYSQISLIILCKKADVLWCPIQQETGIFSQKKFMALPKWAETLAMLLNLKLAVFFFPENYPSKYSFLLFQKKGSLEIFYLPKRCRFFRI